MPPLPSYFVQRNTHFEQIKRFLTFQEASSPGSLVINAVHGMGGIGKTTLAAAIACDEGIRSHFPDGILWATLGEHPNLLARLRERIIALDPAPSADNISEEEATERLQNILIQRKRVLLIMDAEHSFATDS